MFTTLLFFFPALGTPVTTPSFPASTTLTDTGIDQATLTGSGVKMATLGRSGVGQSTLGKRTS